MITAIDLFSGAGGMSHGATLLGIIPVLAIEADKHAAATYAHNHPSTKVLNVDIREIPDNVFEIESETKLLFGGPPCQGFSTSNQKTRNSKNKQNWLFKEFLRVSEIWKPDWMILENVHGLLETCNGFFLNEILGQLNAAGYTCSWWVLNASDYGVPQNRRRLFVVGSLHGATVSPPTPRCAPRLTVKDAIDDLPELCNGASDNWLPYTKKPCSTYAKKMRGKLKKCSNHLVTKNSDLIVKRYKHIPPGGNWENIPLELMQNYADSSRCHTGIYRRLRKSKPSVVIGNYRKNMLIHPTQNRGLSVREAARIQSFPDSFEFKGSIGFQQQQVGNAVPPLLAKQVFKTMFKN